MTNKNFCPAPWVSLYVEPNGLIDNCCVSKNSIGTVSYPVDQVVTGENNIKIQTDMLNDTVVPGCSWCVNSKENLQNTFLTMYPDTTGNFYKPGNFELKYLDARWSNTCNLACVYCSPNFSSLWAQELKTVVKINQEPKNNLLDYVIQNVETLTRVYLAGGEPLLLKENEILIEELVKRNPKCSVLVNTNLSSVNTKLYQRLVSLPNVEWMISFEDTEDRYEYIRYPGKWSQFRSNLLDLLKTVGTHRVTFNMVYLNLNYLSFWDAVDWAESQGFRKNSMAIALYNNGDVFPGPFDINYLNKHSREKAMQRILSKDYSAMYGYQKCLDYLQGPVKINTTFFTRCQEIDQRRNLDSRSIFPDVYESIESVV